MLWQTENHHQRWGPGADFIAEYCWKHVVPMSLEFEHTEQKQGRASKVFFTKSAHTDIKVDKEKEHKKEIHPPPQPNL